MLYSLNTDTNTLSPVKKIRLSDFRWKEKDLQKLLYENLDRVIHDEELIVISQSRDWQEEPDLMAVDERGDLWIFELKAWESESKNLLQVLRYGQIFGQYEYDDLNDLYYKWKKEDLLQTHNNIFLDVKINSNQFNRNQKFVVMTNGLDVKTRQSIKYWRENGIEIIPWIYRLYQIDLDGELNVYIEFNTLRPHDDPLEDVEEDYYVVNTDIHKDPFNDEDMIQNKKAAAYFDPWKYKMKRIKQGDKVFLYRNKEGIVARGIAQSRYKMKDYHDDPEYKNEEYYVPLKNFQVLDKKIQHAEIVELTGVYRRFTTCISIDEESWIILNKEFTKRYREQRN